MSQSTGASFDANVVDRIRKVAAIGFEASKITNIMSSFATANKIPPLSSAAPSSTNGDQLLERYSGQLPFLRTYFRNGDLLQVTIVVDFVLSLANNYDICASIFNMITKTWPIDRTPDLADGPIGYYRFFRNLLACLHQYKLSANESVSVKRLLCDECYPLTADQLERTLDREKVFKNLLKITDGQEQLQTIDDLKNCARKLETTIGDADVDYFKRILSTVVNVQLLLQFQNNRSPAASPTNILSLNISAMIEEIVFDNSVSPLEIEQIAANINTNLVHTLATILSQPIFHAIDENEANGKVLEAIVSEIDSGSERQECGLMEDDASVKPVIKPQSAKVINYIKRHSYLLAYLLNEIVNGGGNVPSESIFLDNLKQLPDVQAARTLYGDNEMMAALNFDRLDVEKLATFVTTTSDFR